MKKSLRPECGPSDRPSLSDATAIFLIRDAVARRRLLIRGKLDDDKGRHCAMGAFWADNPGSVVRSSLLEEVATVNDSLPASATNKQRWKKVMQWLQWKMKTLAEPAP